MAGLVSILIPAFNAERWLPTALDSALRQTWPKTEIIIVDDGSSDGSFALAKKYTSRTVKVVRQDNRGAAAARNRALLESQGDLIQYLDADDILSPEKIEAQARLLGDNTPGLISVSQAVYFQDGGDPDSGWLQDGWPLIDSDDPVQWLVELWGPEGNPGMVPPGAWLTPRELTERAGPWDETVPSPDDDGEYFARVILASRGIRRSRTGRLYYRKFPGGGSYSSRREEQLQWGRLHSIDGEARALLAHTNDARAKRALANRYMELAFSSYPYFPRVTDTALQRVQDMGGTDFIPPFGTWKGEVLRRMFGWKAARRLNAGFHRSKTALRRRLIGNA